MISGENDFLKCASQWNFPLVTGLEIREQF